MRFGRLDLFGQFLPLCTLLSILRSNTDATEISVEAATLQHGHYYTTSGDDVLGWKNEYATAGNPLKGLFASPTFSTFDPNVTSIDAAMDFYYIGLNQMMVRDPVVGGLENAFDWTVLESLLNDSASRYRHAVITVTIHYPGEPLYVPQYLLDAGLTLHYYPDFLGGGDSPDYGDPLLLTAIEQFIFEFGRLYDGDPRIGFLHMGLLGFWGEWHTFPLEFVPEHAKHSTVEWYRTAFTTTQIQGRYPFQPAYEAGFGLLDFSFGYHTLDGDANGGVEHPDYYFWPIVKAANQDDFWRKSVMGGETRPELQDDIFDPHYPAGTFQKQDFIRCLYTTHATYMLHHHAFVYGGYEGEKLERANHAHTRMGYNFMISSLGVMESDTLNDSVTVEVIVQQVGVAPFYYPLSLALDCLGLEEPLYQPGVETVIDSGASKSFTFSGVPASSDCLDLVRFSLESPFAYEGRPIKFAQGEFGVVEVSLPMPASSSTSESTSPVPNVTYGNIMGFTLVQASIDFASDLGAVEDGYVFDISQVGTALSMRADTTGSVRSIVFDYDGTTHSERRAPYSLNGDVVLKYFPVAYLSYAGNKTIVAAAIDSTGATLDTMNVTFAIVDSVSDGAYVDRTTTSDIFENPHTGSLDETEAYDATEVNETYSGKYDNAFSEPTSEPSQGPTPPKRSPTASPTLSYTASHTTSNTASHTTSHAAPHTASSTASPTLAPSRGDEGIHGFNTPTTPDLLKDVVAATSGALTPHYVFPVAVGAAVLSCVMLVIFVCRRRRRRRESSNEKKGKAVSEIDDSSMPPISAMQLYEEYEDTTNQTFNNFTSSSTETGEVFRSEFASSKARSVTSVV